MGGSAQVRARHATLALLLATTATATLAQAPASAGLAGPAHCRFAAPAGWDTRQVRWTGDCRAGLAQGLGTLRAMQGNKVVRTFYGRLKDGQPVLGVIERDGGFQAGRFEGGAVVQDGERNTLIQAFDEARAAADAVALRHQASGNPASARYYRQKAAQLASQID